MKVSNSQWPDEIHHIGKRSLFSRINLSKFWGGRRWTWSLTPASWPSSLFIVTTLYGWKATCVLEFSGADGGKGTEGLSLLQRKISSHSFSYSITFVRKVLIIEDIFFSLFLCCIIVYTFQGSMWGSFKTYLASLTLYPNQRHVELSDEVACILDLVACIYQSSTPVLCLPLSISSLVATSLFSTSVSLFLFCYVHSFVLFLDFTCKW